MLRSLISAGFPAGNHTWNGADALAFTHAPTGSHPHPDSHPTPTTPTLPPPPTQPSDMRRLTRCAPVTTAADSYDIWRTQPAKHGPASTTLLTAYTNNHWITAV